MSEEILNQSEIKKEQPQKSQEIPIQLPELSELGMLSAKVVELENNISQYKDQLLRKAAEFENYKKRIANDYTNLVKFSNEDLIEKLLPVLDDFERSLRAIKSKNVQQNENTQEESFVKGVELIFNKFKRILELQGLKHFEVVSQPFDPQLHDALMQIQTKEYPPQTVLEEIEKGYMLHDKVLRHAKVIVSAEAVTPEAHESGKVN